jgi:SAM-dependent methyltransferase
VGFDFWARGATPGVLRMLESPGRVAELGCGSGIAAAMLLDAGYEVFGVDQSEPLLRRARERAPAGKFVRASLHDVELPPCVAVVAMGEILSYAGITDELLARVRGALSPGGLFVFDVGTPGRGGGRSWHAGDGWLVCSEAVEDGTSLTRSIVSFRAVGDGAWRRSDEVHRLTLYSPDQLVSRLGDAGFVDVRVLEDGYGPELELPSGIAVLSARAPAPTRWPPHLAAAPATTARSTSSSGRTPRTGR